ncbi:MAG: transglycosylase SLT domain-containing protein [Bacteroidales bacterium]|nr:transglycosylase SLT domain-containing protein [Bacteroidales bacterium]
MGRRSFLFIIFLVLFFSCNHNHTSEHTVQTSFRDLEGILERGKLVAVTDYNPTNYFIYKGEPMGFNFELLNLFATHIGVDLEIRTENDIESAIGMLNNGEADLLAMSLPVNGDLNTPLRFTQAIHETRQVLIQRKPDKWRTMTADRVNASLLRNHLELADKVIYVPKGSFYSKRISHIQREIGDTIYTVELPYETEGLVSLVAKGEIDYTICDESYARVAATFYPNLDINTPVSFSQKRSWAMRPLESEELGVEFDNWFRMYRNSRAYAFLYAKYFKNPRTGTIYSSRYYANSTGRISPWDEMIKSYSDSISWDWRLLAALIYQESRFDPYVTSHAGAYGLMQVMPSTGNHFGIDITSTPENNIRAGMLYIRWLEKMFSDRIPDQEERIRFILASYNAGPGHVLDAMRLANSEGIDSSTWYGSVESYILKKSDPRYYNHPEVQHGYFTGRETVSFVTDILKRYDHYRNIIK